MRHSPSTGRTSRGLLGLLGALALVSAPLAARSQALPDEITFFGQAGSYTPGEQANVRYWFWSRPDFAASSFGFLLEWESPEASLQGNGPGSLASLADALAPLGTLTIQQTLPQSVTASWTSSHPVPGGAVIPIGVLTPLVFDFAFSTPSSLQDGLRTHLTLFDMHNDAGVLVDFGSGMFAHAVATPVPEPAAGLAMLAGCGVITWVWRRGQILRGAK